MKTQREWEMFRGVVLGMLASWFSMGLAAQSIDPSSDFFQRLNFRHIGPVGNRVSAVVGVPGDANIYYIGAASGGVFKTTDGGVHWEAIFDDQPAASIGALAVDPINPNIVWAGTGETFIRSNVSIGNGIYKTTDGGKTWRHLGLEGSGRIGRVVVNPLNHDVVIVAALGHLYGPQEDRGVYRTDDGGETWERVLFVDENTGAVDVVMDPNNPEILFAAMWQMEIRTWGRTSGGPGSGLYKSKDGGLNWERMEGRGLPGGQLGKIGLAMSADNSERIYALIETNSNREFAPLDEHDGVLWRSDNGGDSWRMVNGDHTLAQRPLYYTRAVAAPDDHNEIHFMSTAHTTSYDGGVSVERGSAGGDNHDMWIDPLLPDRMIVGHDGGVSISTTRGREWMRPRLPIAQMYHVYTDNQIPYNVFGNRQDGASHRGPSNSLTYGSIPIGAWHSVGGCESGFSIPDPVNNNIVWSGCYEGILDRYDVGTGHSQTVSVWPDNPEGWPAAELRYRFQWTFPIAISPHDHNRVYVGSQSVHQTTDGGRSWVVISPDLTTNDKTKQERSGGLTPDDVSPTYGAVLFAIAESPLEEGVIWAGSNDGLIHVTRDGGGTWENVTPSERMLPLWGTVSNVEPSRHSPGTAYVSVDLHQVNDTHPYIFRTTDYGSTWTQITDGIPESVFSYVHVVREDPIRSGLLFAGTENGLYVSWDDGNNWNSLQNNLPHAPVYWLTIQEHFSDLVVGTYGRGFWILDDISPIRQFDSQALSSDVHLFEPRAAYRFRMKDSHVSQPSDPGAGENPPYGASIDYFLPDDVGNPISLSIEDASGTVIRTISRFSREPGLNRAYWDLSLESSQTPRMRTGVLEHSHVTIGDDGWRPAGEMGRVVPLAEPGEYTVKLTVGDREWTRSLTVLKDPNSEGTEADISQQVEMVLDLRGNANETVDLINESENIRHQLDELKREIGGHADEDSIVGMIRGADQAVIDLEMLLTDLRLSGGMAGQDRLRWPRRLYAKIVSLAGYVGGSDFSPTTQQREVHQLYVDLLAEYQLRMESIYEEQIVPLNEFLQTRRIPRIQTALRKDPGISDDR